MTKVAAVIIAENAAEAERQARAALSKGADLVELRLDAFKDLGPAAVQNLSQSVGARAIATLRSPSQGGAQMPREAVRTALLETICSQPFAYVDLELVEDRKDAERLADLARSHRSEVIVSHHFAEPVEPAAVVDALQSCAAFGDVAKVALPVADVEMASHLVEIAHSEADRSRRIVLIGMGPVGTMTRALADSAGQEIQYAAWGNAASRSGQLTLSTAKRLRGVEPFLLGLVGHPLSHSFSPAIHEAALAFLDLPGVYLPFDIEGESIDGLLRAAGRLRLRGFNVTIPYKEAIAEKLDELDGDARELGAVNTVVVEDGRTTGHNTDVDGFRISLRALDVRVGGRDVLVVGAGGSARAVVHVLLREGARVHVTNRTLARAESLAESFDEPVEVIENGDLMRQGPWVLLVNATPVGTKGFDGGLPVPEPVVAKAAFVYDLVYNPVTTPLLRAARRLGRPGASGLEMLLQQAAVSFELWTGRSAPFDSMRRAAAEAIQ